MNLLLCRLLQQIALSALAIRPIDARDSKIRPELRTYSKFEDELKAIRNPPNGGRRNPIDSAGSESVNKFLSKGSDSEEIESIDEEDEQHPDSTPSSVRLELNKEALDNQTTLTDPPNLNEIKLANKTMNSTNSKPIDQTTASGNHSDSSDASRSSSDQHLNETVNSNGTMLDSSNANDDVSTSRTTSEAPLSVLTTEPLNQTTEATGRLKQTTANDHDSQIAETSSPLSQTTASNHLSQTTESLSHLEQTALSSHLSQTTASDHLNQTTEATSHPEQTTASDHLSSSTEAPYNRTAIQPLVNSPNQTSDSTIESRNNETITMPNFAPTAHLDLNLTHKNNTPSDSSAVFSHKPCYTLDELELMVS